jgi:putative glycosyltransferase (TIGR04348 family)
VVIVTPAPPGSRHGNRNTATRWAAHLRALGHRVRIVVDWTSAEAASRADELMLALHARRSHAAMREWRAAPPRRPLVLALTGTDLYRDIRVDANARASLDMADRMIVLQPRGLRELSVEHRRKTEVVYQSVRAVKRQPPPRRYFLVSVIGHLREEKDPFRAVKALAHLPAASRVRVVQLGGAMSDAYAREARARMRTEPRYRWLGELDHAGAMRWLAKSHVMVISSVMEGGAHVVSEAIAAGVPVIASDVPGNVGLLGEDYPGYYPVGDTRALARLLARAENDPRWLARLGASVRARRKITRAATERAALAGLLKRV